MKTYSPKKLALIISLAISSISAFLMIIMFIHEHINYWIYLIISAIITFGICYFFILYILRNYIFDKIKLIYKTIHQFNIDEKELRKRVDNPDIITGVNMEVAEWMQKKTNEIANLKQLEKYRKEFLGNVSHELKTPIFNIQGYVLTLLDGGIDDPTINKKYLVQTEKNINRLISIVEDLEAISGLESGELKLKNERFDIVQLIREVFDMLDREAKLKNIRLAIAGETQLKNIMVIADRQRILQVLTNLINNSIKYGKQDGKTTISIFDMDKNLLIEVTDDGIGIEEKHLQRIFERFYRVDKSRSREQGGTGLGLAIVKHIIEAHEQTINVRSKPGEGTSFAFTLKKG